MTHRKALTAAVVALLALAGGQLGAPATIQAAAEPRNPGIVRLHGDATAGLRIERDASGVADFVGTTAGSSIVNPTVTGSTSIRSAARAHLARYGAALGLASDAQLSITRTEHSVSGQDVVRFQQEVDSAPVLGGQVVVSLHGDRQLSSMLSTVSSLHSLPPATVSEATARVTAERAATRAAGATGLATTTEGRWVWDPALFGATNPSVAQGVWRFEVSDGVGVRRMVLVDDTSGRVLVNLDRIEHLNRVVCDRDNMRGAASSCTSGFARAEGGPASPVTDVNAAFDNAGSVSVAYAEIAGIDLTDRLGIDVGGQKVLAATVRFCQSTGECPYANAFWNGTQMFYGDTYAVADDVVGHELTHGVIDQYSELLYWGQSGAINESMADIMGEIVDHRAGLEPGDADWLISEDLPIGALRNMSDPTAKGDPDRMTSPHWNADLDPSEWGVYGPYPDSGGVHSNSGVGNKTAYLISQGGSFNGRTVTGIDGPDPGLTKTGRLYFDAITKLTSGSDYANLAAVLEQSCADFVTSGTGGFTAADCASVATAVLATELRTTPTQAPQPAEVAVSCPTGTTVRELFNGEAGDPTAKFTGAGGLWNYGADPFWGSNATSDKDSWLGYDPDPFNYGDPTAASLATASSIVVPPGQSTYLNFQQWRLFEWSPGASPKYVDGGTVEVDAGAGPVDTAGLPWVNGPQQTLQASGAGIANPWAGRTAFGGDSFGWTSSQLDLSSFAGQSVTPQFTVRGDLRNSFIGWWLDDIVVYTCDVPAPPAIAPQAPASPPSVAPVPSTTKLKVTTGRSVRFVATVKISTGAPATGKVTFRVDRRAHKKTVTLKKGKAVLRLSRKQVIRLGEGKHTVKAAYSGSKTAKASRAKARFHLH